MYVIATQGGGFNGIKQVPVVEGLYARRKPDYHFGVSTGALVASLASADNLQAFRGVLEGLDDSNPVDGIKGVMKPAFDGKGWYSLETLRGLLEDSVKLSGLQVPVGIGVTLKESRKYHTFHSSRISRNRRLHNAILGSCAVAGVWSPPPRVKVAGRRYTLVDGGHIHSIPFIPPMVGGRKVTELDVVLSTPMDPPDDRYRDVDGMLESFAWMIETAFAQTMIHGLEHLHMLAKPGVTVRVFSPRTAVGGYAKADADTIEAQYAEGDWMLRNPVTL